MGFHPSPMDIKRILRGPFFWIAIAVLVALVVSQVVSGASAPKKVDTGELIQTIQKSDLKQATLVDRDQRIEVTLPNDAKLQARYVDGQGVDLQQLLQEKFDAGAIAEGYNIEVPEQSILVTLLVSLLPIILIVFLLFFFMNQMQGGGGRAS